MSFYFQSICNGLKQIDLNKTEILSYSFYNIHLVNNFKSSTLKKLWQVENESETGLHYKYINVHRYWSIKHFHNDLGILTCFRVRLRKAKKIFPFRLVFTITILATIKNWRFHHLGRNIKYSMWVSLIFIFIIFNRWNCLQNYVNLTVVFLRRKKIGKKSQV